MITGLVIIAIIVGIGIYDFYNTNSWQMVTSVDRNNKVFENRNKSYGAYEIRRNYDKRLILIILSIGSGIGLTSAAVNVFRDNTPPKPSVTIDIPENDPMDQNNKKDEIVEKTETENKPAAQQAMQQFIGFKIDTQAIINDTVGPIDPGTPVGTETKPGDTGFNPTDGGEGQGNGNGESKPITQDENEVPFDITEEAYFQGGKGKMIQFIVNNISKNIEFSGTCKVRFVVKKDGSIGKIWVVKKVPNCPECDQSVVETVQKMPLWVPAKQNGTPVNSYFILPVTFE